MPSVWFAFQFKLLKELSNTIRKSGFPLQNYLCFSLPMIFYSLNEQLILKLVAYLLLKLAQQSNADPCCPFGKDKLEMQQLELSFLSPKRKQIHLNKIYNLQNIIAFLYSEDNYSVVNVNQRLQICAEKLFCLATLCYKRQLLLKYNCSQTHLSFQLSI